MQRFMNLAGAVLLVLAGCPNEEPSADTMQQASGFAQSSSGDDGTTDTPTSNTPTTQSSVDDTGEPWGGTAYVGEIRGLLTLTYTPAHSLVSDDTVGMAGGYRTAELGWDGSEDLYSPVAYQLAFPPPPDAADTLMPAEAVPVFDWGDDEAWLFAGNGMKLRQGEDGPEILACLLVTGTYPLYRTSAAMGVPDECTPAAASWSPSTLYDVVLYGGELFADNVLLERVTTPAELTVTAPDLTAFNAAVPVDSDLAITWDAGDDLEARIIIRVIDQNANVITVHAADDGDFTIPAAELSGLNTGPIDLSIARERTDRVQFTDGGLTVLSRYERWGFFDLF